VASPGSGDEGAAWQTMPFDGSFNDGGPKGRRLRFSPENQGTPK